MLRYCGAPKVVRPPDLSLTGASGRRAAAAAGEGGGGEVQVQGRQVYVQVVGGWKGDPSVTRVWVCEVGGLAG